MNDFTKEELEELINWTEYLAGHSPSLLKKIKTMIEGYCEHEWIIETKKYDVANAKCSKCWKKFNE